MEAVVEWVGKVLGSIFGTYNERVITGYWEIVRDRIRPLEFGAANMREIQKAIKGADDPRLEDGLYLKHFRESGIEEKSEALKREFHGKLNEDNIEEEFPDILFNGGFRALPDDSFKLVTSMYKKKVEGVSANIREVLNEEDEDSDRVKELLEQGNEMLEEILPTIFAMVREASRRVLKMRHYDVQLIGGIVLSQGNIAEMATGEGKTLVATLPTSLHALFDLGVHVVTVNDYLARRDVQWMGPLYDFLGYSIGVLQNDATFMYDREHDPGPVGGNHNLVPVTKEQAYKRDILYGTNNEFGFDYLRDNMKIRLDAQSQLLHYFAIVDEVDSILIDEARTPLIISGPSDESIGKYSVADRVARMLKKDMDYTVKEKERMVILTESGLKKAEKLAGVEDFYTGENMDWPHYIETGLKARNLYQKDKDYLIKDGNVIIIDEFTGRTMEGRRWSDGLHQAVEAKEGVKIKEESQTLATITLQNYFRMYHKLAGMTGTAVTEATEFEKIYKLEVISIPTNKFLRRSGFPDVIYATEKEKFEAVADDIERTNKEGRPVLVGTTSVEKSEYLSRLLQIRGVSHEVLNAKHHEKEAYIVANAGQKGSVTISTNMAGRGTDIILGDGVADLGGLHVIATERHEARRIDNQLRGRAGRQGDPGSSQFFLSLEDDLLRLFMPPWSRNVMQKMGLKDGEKIESKLITRSIEKAQKNVETRNFDIRKNLLEYDEVMNKQRKVVYELRQRVLKKVGLKEIVTSMIHDFVENTAYSFFMKEMSEEEWDYDGFCGLIASKTGIKINVDEIKGREPQGIAEIAYERLMEAYDKKEIEFGEEIMREIEKMILSDRIDYKWKDHLYNIDQLRDTISLRGYAQLDPKLEYKKDATDLFAEMFDSIKDDVSSLIFRIHHAEMSEEKMKRRWAVANLRKDSVQTIGEGGLGEKKQAQSQEEEAPQPVTVGPKVGRNEPCPCGSGKKYKKCCGMNEV